MSTGRSRKVTVRGRRVDVDILPPDQLEAISTGMQRALEKEPVVIWPAARSTGYRKRVHSMKLVSVVPQLRLVPLDRLGGMQGYSGSKVFIGYFVDAIKSPHRRRLPSRPLVVKIGNAKELGKEKAAAERLPIPLNEDRFAKPLFFWEHPSTSLGVLVAPYSSHVSLDLNQTGYELQIVDLWTKLHDRRPDVAALTQSLCDAYELLHGIHRNDKYECDQVTFQVGEEYKWYLRQLDRRLISIPKDIFGSDPTTTFCGMRFSNPIHVLEKALRVNCRGSRGPIQGDLHPKNIVFDKDGRTNVIDFGWARSAGHIVKDYVLMEINLRAMTLSPHIPIDALLPFCGSLLPSDPYSGGCTLLQDRTALIKNGIRSSIATNKIVSDWQREYLIPLFVVAFGLLKHLSKARNQLALLLTVLQAGERVHQSLGGSGATSKRRAR